MQNCGEKKKVFELETKQIVMSVILKRTIGRSVDNERHVLLTH